MRWSLLIGLMFAAIIVPFLLFEKQFEALGAWLASGHASGWTSASIIAGLLALDVFLPVPSSAGRFPFSPNRASCLPASCGRRSRRSPG